MSLTDEQMLVHLAKVAQQRFKLTVWQWKPGPCAGHAPGSLHYQCFPHTNVGRAFDAYAPMNPLGLLRMARYARWLRKAHKARLTEGIFNGRFTRLSVKHGRDVAPSFWGTATWRAHTNHVHVGI